MLGLILLRNIGCHVTLRAILMVIVGFVKVGRLRFFFLNYASIQHLAALMTAQMKKNRIVGCPSLGNTLCLFR